jgi:hypothetical protein
MRYRLASLTQASTEAPSITGAIIAAPPTQAFRPWLPSTWPPAPGSVHPAFIGTLRTIFRTSVLGEIGNVIADVKANNGSLEHRGHVIGIALMCALDSISSYGYRGQSSAKFVIAHFPSDYHPFALDVYNLYRVSLVHKWNLLAAILYSDDTPIHRDKGIVAFGLLNFFDALQRATEDYLHRLSFDEHLQGNTLRRYEELKGSAVP